MFSSKLIFYFPICLRVLACIGMKSIHLSETLSSTINLQDTNKWIIYTSSFTKVNIPQFHSFIRVSFNSTYVPKDLMKPVNKFGKLYNLIVCPVQKFYTNVFLAFRYQAELISSLFLFVSNINVKNPTAGISIFEANLPAIKLFEQSITTNNSAYSVYCNGFCTPSEQMVKENDMQKIFANPIKFHESIFRNGNSKTILGLVQIRLGLSMYLRKYSKNPTACTRLMFKHPDSFLCSAEPIAMFYIATVHNITLELKPRTNWKYMAELRQPGTTEQFITTRKADPDNPAESISVHLGKQYTRTTHMYPIYCTFLNHDSVQSKSIDGSIWMKNLEVKACLAILVCFLLYQWLQYKLKHENVTFYIVINIFGNLTKQPLQTSFVTLAFAGMFLCIYYENCITSVVLSPIYPKRFATLQEALDSGYKFRYSHGFSNFFKWRFHQLNLYHRINSSYINLDKKTIQNNTKFITDQLMYAGYDVNLDINIYHIRRDFDPNSRNSTQCHVIGQFMQEYFEVWEMVAQNRYWMMITASRIQDSGLDAKWDEWANLRYIQRIGRLRTHLQQKKISRVLIGTDAIDKFKFFAPALVWVFMCAASLLICMLEKLYFLRVRCALKSLEMAQTVKNWVINLTYVMRALIENVSQVRNASLNLAQGLEVLVRCKTFRIT